MPYDQWLPLILLALTMSFTPGPNNTIATVTAVNFGFRATLPHAAGVPCGFGTMLLAAAGGIAALLLTYPVMTQLLKWLGIGYLLWLSWQMLRADPVADRGNGLLRLPLSFTSSALFQYVNPKGWMFALAVTSAYVVGEHLLSRVLAVVLVCIVCCIMSVLTWAWLGSGLRHWLQQGQRRRGFNIIMAVSLAATALWMSRSS